MPVKTVLAIREARCGDADAIWAILEPVIRAGDTYALPRDMRRDDALCNPVTLESPRFNYRR